MVSAGSKQTLSISRTDGTSTGTNNNRHLGTSDNEDMFVVELERWLSSVLIVPSVNTSGEALRGSERKRNLKNSTSTVTSI